MRVKNDPKIPVITPIPVQTEASITDFQYNHSGNQLAISDSDGFIYIYSRNGDKFEKSSQFKGDEAAIWKISWADPQYGDTLAIGSFKRKVAVFQKKDQNWTEAAYHQLHEGSVNHVEWASSAFGLKLYSAGSDGTIAILELKKNNWAQSSFAAHQSSISSLSLRSLALNEEQQQRSSAYPLLATVAKDNSIKIWRHTSQIKEEKLDHQARIYQQVTSYKPHSSTIRSVLWKKRWTQAQPIEYEIFSCSEDGFVKLAAFRKDQLLEVIDVCQHDHPVFKISQSLTGNILTVSVGNERQQTFIYTENQNWESWKILKEIQ